MLKSLKIRNVALIEDLYVEFHSGMHILAGETGAGKSIVVDAVNLVLGGRADKNLIRFGTDKATVEAVFSVPNHHEIQRILDRENIDFDGSTVHIWREISSGGKNVCRICGVMLPVSVLKELAEYLMDIHGQHEHQFLMDPVMHRVFIDKMGDENHQKLLAQTAKDCEAFLSVHRTYAGLRKEQSTKQQKIAYLEVCLKELHEADLKEGEEEELQQKALKLRDAEKNLMVFQSVLDLFSGGPNGTGSLENIREAFQILSSVKNDGQKTDSLAQRCESAYYELEEIQFEIQKMADLCDMDPGLLERTEARLDLIRKTEKKYGPEIRDILAAQHRMEEEYAELCSLDDRINETAREHKRLLGIYRSSARSLSESRKKIAETFEYKMMAELKDLGMERTVFKVVFAPKPEDKRQMPRPSGDDDLEFMIAPNPGEPMKSLIKIASGGELSRMMLAIKALEASTSGVDCMVFDEIDTGISGRMAQAVAEKMILISRHRQVICVSHLPQIASAADWQYLVHKEVCEGRTFTDVRELNDKERIQEIAHMITGADGAERDAVIYAGSLLEAAREKKKEFDEQALQKGI